MAIERTRGDAGKRWRVRWRTLGGESRSRRCPDRKTAEALDAEIKRAHARGVEWQPEVVRDRPRLADVARAYVDARRIRVRPSTLRMEGAHLDVFLRFCGARGLEHLDQLRRSTLDEFLAWTLAPESARHGHARRPGSAARVVEAAWLLWRWAEDSERWEGVPRSPRALDLPRSQPAPVVAPTWAEMDAMLAACSGWHRQLATWLRWTGLRSGESMLVEWTDIDMLGGVLTIRPEIDKNGEGRRVPLAGPLLDTIAGWGRREGYVIKSGRAAGVRAREPRSRDAARAWARAGVRLEAYQRHPWHAFRRGFKSGLLGLGAHPDAVDYLQGHALGSGSRGRYIDAAALPLREALAMVPAIGSVRGVSENVTYMPRQRR